MTTRRRRAAATLAGALTVALGTAGATAGPALAKTCPNNTVTRVSAKPSYTYVRGCIRSFDGTPIVYNLFEPLNPKPGSLYTILEGPGWGGGGDTSPDEKLIAAGYAEMTWDPRGFGQSGGVAEVDSPAAEGADVKALITKVLSGRPEIAVDTLGQDGQPAYTNDFKRRNTKGQPVVGMTGFSYGGGIEWSAAVDDSRIKAIAPGGSWNDLDYSLDPGGVIKLGWGELLYGAGLGEATASHVQGDAPGFPAGGDGGNQTGGYDPQIHTAEAEGLYQGYWSRQTLAWFHQRSYAEYGIAVRTVNVPTLAYQGSVDTLFNLNDAWNSIVETRADHPNLPLKMIAFCGGHVGCPTGAPPNGENYSDTASKASPIAPGDSAGAYTEAATIAWFNHYLRGDAGSATALDKLVPAGANVVYQDQSGNLYPVSTFPTPARPGPARYVSAKFGGTLVEHNLPTGASGTPAGVDVAVTDGATPSGDPAQTTVPVLTARGGDVPIVGIGRVTANVTVEGNSANLFFRLIDARTGNVLDLQTAALRVDNLDLEDNGTSANLPPQAVPISVDLAGVTYDLPKGDTLELQVSTSSNSFVPNRGAGVVTITGVKVSVPTLDSQG